MYFKKFRSRSWVVLFTCLLIPLTATAQNRSPVGSWKLTKHVLKDRNSISNVKAALGTIISISSNGKWAVGSSSGSWSYDNKSSLLTLTSPGFFSNWESNWYVRWNGRQMEWVCTDNWFGNIITESRIFERQN